MPLKALNILPTTMYINALSAVFFAGTYFVSFFRTDDAKVIINNARILTTPGKVCIMNEAASHNKNLPTGYCFTYL